MASADESLKAAEAARDAAIMAIGNLVHDTVPVDDDEVTVTSYRYLRWQPCARHCVPGR